MYSRLMKGLRANDVCNEYRRGGTEMGEMDVLVHSDDLDVAMLKGITEDDTADTTLVANGGECMRFGEIWWPGNTHRNWKRERGGSDQ